MADENKEELLSSLCEILDIDQDLARYYLEKMRWSVEGAVNEFYADTTEMADGNTLMTKPPSYAESEGETSHGSQSESDQPGNNSPGGDGASRLNLLCWNLDGLDERDLEVRTAAVLNAILLKKPDVVFLQEVVPYSLKVFQDSCEGYMVLFGDFTVPYFNAFLIRKSSVQTKESALQFVEFPTSKMGRHYLIQPIKFADAKIILLTSHFESLGTNAAERKKQLKEVLDYMKRQNPGFNVLFGGDTNLRDSEVSAIGGLPDDIQDAWTSCGSQLTTKYTWDMSVNDNLQMPGKSKLRFDRIFLRPASSSKALALSSFTLMGKERLESCRRFPSDHWGIWLQVNID